jgi:serine protease Do
MFVIRFSLACLLACVLCTSYAQVPKNSSSEPTSSAQPALPEPSASARDLFSRYKDRLLQVRVLLNSANEQSSLGSGFVVRDDGAQGAWVLTNYHVISSLAIDPEKYRIELRGTNGRSVKAKLVALDVIHDLAVLRTDPSPDVPAWNVFTLREKPLAQGSKIFSLGNPLELGFLISEGIYNGLVESRIYDEMLFSGALNSGMSGGPAIDEQGLVVGVNVATRRDGEQLSFLVPVRYARDLLARALASKPGKDWRKNIAQQLLAHQDFLMTKLLGKPVAALVAVPSPVSAAAVATATLAVTPSANSAQAKAGFSSQTLAGRAVPTLDGNLTKCWASGREGEKQRYQRDTLNCNLRSSLFVRGKLHTGTMSLQHVLLHNDKLATAQFLAIKDFGIQGASWSARAEQTASECRSSYVQPAKHVYRASICLVAYRKFEGIYDYTVTVTQIDDTQERQTSTLQLQGFSFENSQKLANLFLERLQ